MKKFCKAIIRCALIMALVMSFQKIKTLNCEAYKIGKFSKFIYNNSGLGHWTRQEIFIERNDTIQKETMQMFTELKHHGIEWTVEEDALAFLTDAGLVGRNVMSQQNR